MVREESAGPSSPGTRGVRGPDITQVWASGRTDDGLFKTLRNGVPNTEMPANPRLSDRETWQLLAYLRTLKPSGKPTPLPQFSAQDKKDIASGKYQPAVKLVSATKGVLKHSTRPVLLVPQDAASLSLRNVIVCWKDARESRRAISDALPLLRAASHASVLEVCKMGQRALADRELLDVAGWLRRQE